MRLCISRNPSCRLTGAVARIRRAQAGNGHTADGVSPPSPTEWRDIPLVIGLKGSRPRRHGSGPLCRANDSCDDYGAFATSLEISGLFARIPMGIELGGRWPYRAGPWDQYRHPEVLLGLV